MHTFYVRHTGEEWVGDINETDCAGGKTLDELHASAALVAEIIDGPHDDPRDEAGFSFLSGQSPLASGAGAELIAHTTHPEFGEYALTRVRAETEVLQLHRITYAADAQVSLSVTSIDLPIDVAVWLVPAVDRGAYAVSLRAGMKALGRLTKGKGKGKQFGVLANAWPPPVWREQLRWASK